MSNNQRPLCTAQPVPALHPRSTHQRDDRSHVRIKMHSYVLCSEPCRSERPVHPVRLLRYAAHSLHMVRYPLHSPVRGTIPLPTAVRLLRNAALSRAHR